MISSSAGSSRMVVSWPSGRGYVMLVMLAVVVVVGVTAVEVALDVALAFLPRATIGKICCQALTSFFE